MLSALPGRAGAAGHSNFTDNAISQAASSSNNNNQSMMMNASVIVGGDADDDDEDEFKLPPSLPAQAAARLGRSNNQAASSSSTLSWFKKRTSVPTPTHASRTSSKFGSLMGGTASSSSKMSMFLRSATTAGGNAMGSALGTNPQGEGGEEMLSPISTTDEGDAINYERLFGTKSLSRGGA